MLSPLRYPGSKVDFVQTVATIVEGAGLSGSALCEPYAGSAAVAIGLLEANSVKHATILERDPLLYAFWKCVFERTDELLVRFQGLPITLDTWHALRPQLNVENVTNANLVDLGLAGLFFNRTNFSGILNGGPIGGKGQKSQYKIDCRTNKDSVISRILAIASFSDLVTVEFGDALKFIGQRKRLKSPFFYIDPPYFNKGELLYRHSYRHGDHKRLAAMLNQCSFPWLLSYDAHPVVEFLYEDQHIKRHVLRYRARSPKFDQELLIANFPLPDLEDWE